MMGAYPASGLAQGIASRGVASIPRQQASGLPFDAHLLDVAAQAGLTEPTICGPVGYKNYILETIGFGAAFFDYDGDGWLDIFLLSGTRFDEAPESASNRLYKNNRDGTFTEVTAESGLGRAGWASAVCVGDFDNDGHEDLFVTYWGQNVLYRNNGDGTFSDVTGDAGLLETGSHWGSGCSFVDYDRDGHLDLFVANYLRFDPASTPKKGATDFCRWKGVPVNCGPRGLPPGNCRLYRNNGNGTFADVSEASGIASAEGGYCMTVAAADFDNDGWPDIYVACDSTPSFFFHNQGDGTFREEGFDRGVAVNEDGIEQAGMGLGIGDPDLDGSLDILKTHFADDTHILYGNNGKGDFEDLTVRCGLGVEARYVGWGAGIADLDNDGRPDLLIVTGNVYPEVERHLPAYPMRTPRLLFRNLGNGQFEQLLEEGGPGVSASHASRGCAFGDFDNDGDVDVLVVNLDEPPSLLRNDLQGRSNWLKVELEGVRSNRSAIGATVVAAYGSGKQAQAVMSQSSFYSCNDRRLHFGLGAETQADLEIRWPSGGSERIERVAANRLLSVREGDGIVKSTTFPIR